MQRWVSPQRRAAAASDWERKADWLDALSAPLPVQVAPVRVEEHESVPVQLRWWQRLARWLLTKVATIHE
jgi:hypothetical protein